MKKENINIKKFKENSNLQLSLKEQTSLKKNFIVPFHSAFQDSDFLYISMKWGGGADLSTFLKPGSLRACKLQDAGEDAVMFILGCAILGL